jgi:catechol 2,3-dioxygenase-like lactoylglutathione lyase family enzyme
MPRPSTKLTATVIGTRHPHSLATFYAALLGWEIRRDEGDWVTVRDPAGGPGLSFQLETLHRRPVWPQNAVDQQMMMHLDIQVDDLDKAVEYAISLGASTAEFQPQDDVIVCYDPDGHPFCLWIATVA